MTKTITLLVLALILKCSPVLTESLRITEKQILNTILSGYDNRIRPFDNEDKPVKVLVNLHLRNIEEIDPLHGRLKVQITFRQSWNDHRLKYDSITSKIHQLNIRSSSDVWIPDTYFSSTLGGSRLNIINENEMIRIKPNGDIMYKARLQLQLACPFELGSFPFDTQSCEIKFASNGLPSEDVAYDWEPDDPVTMSNKLNLNLPYRINYCEPDQCSYKSQTGDYSCLKANLRFSNQMKSRIFILIYGPLTLLVLIGYGSFWIERSRVGLRIGYCLSTLLLALLITAQFNHHYQSNVNRAVDCWCTVSSIFVGFTLMVSIWIGQTEARADKLDLERQDGPAVAPLVIDQKRSKREEILERINRIRSIRSKRLDQLGRIIYPAAFAVYALLYLFWYCVIN